MLQVSYFLLSIFNYHVDVDAPLGDVGVVRLGALKSMVRDRLETEEDETGVGTAGVLLRNLAESIERLSYERLSFKEYVVLRNVIVNIDAMEHGTWLICLLCVFVSLNPGSFSLFWLLLLPTIISFDPGASVFCEWFSSMSCVVDC